MHRKTLLALAVSAACAGHLAPASAQRSAAADVDEVIVYGTQGLTEGATGSRLALTALETPASVDVIDGAAVRSRVDLSVVDAVTRSAGFTSEVEPGSGHSSIAARGFRGQGSVTKLYDGTNYYTAAGTITFPFDTWSVERIEVLKGPSSVLYGEGGIGGAINIIPRKPSRTAAGELRVLAGENATTFFGVDYTNGLGDALAYRVDYGKSESDNWVSNGDSDAEMLALSLAWEASDDLTISARYDSGEQNPMRYFGVPVVNGGFFDPFVESNFNVGDAEVRYEDDALRLKADWRASDTVSLAAEIYRLESDRFWKNSEYYWYDDARGLVERYDPLILGHDITQDGIRANLVLTPAGERVRASVGVEKNDVSFVRPTNFGPGNPLPVDFDTDFDTVNPLAFVPGTLASLTPALPVFDNRSDVSQYALFAEAQLHATDRLSVVLGMRYDDYDTVYERVARATIDQQVDALTGRVGVVYDLDDDTAFYAQYGTGATHPSDSIVTAAAINAEAEMIESEQLEVGLKHQVAGTGLSWTLALFDITKNNLIEDDPTSGDPADVLFIPEQTSAGIELGFTFALSPGLQIYGNVASLDAETDTGETPSYVPEQTANFGVAWTIADVVHLVADARYVGERFEPSLPMPKYTVLDVAARFDVSDNLVLTLKADNVLDELYAAASYYSDTWLVGKPRSLSLVMDYRF